MSKKAKYQLVHIIDEPLNVPKNTKGEPQVIEDYIRELQREHERYLNSIPDPSKLQKGGTPGIRTKDDTDYVIKHNTDNV